MTFLEEVKFALRRDGVVRRSDVEWLVSEVDKLTHSLTYLDSRCEKLTDALQEAVVLLGAHPENLELVTRTKKELLGGGEGVDLESADDVVSASKKIISHETNTRRK
jgi:hypothetical protein